MIDLPVQYWPAALVLAVSVTGGVLGGLRVFGLLSHPADAGDLKILQTRFQLLENFHHENREEHAAIRKEIAGLSRAVARIEGKLC